jgi:2-(1,2-epoxy-1,2-dihydrophenyl)acetyl-CoA isomerase
VEVNAMSEPIELTKDGQIAVAMFNRPEKYNALGAEDAEYALQVLNMLSADDTIRAVVISGKGKAFCAGGDLKWVLDYPHGLAAAIHQFVGHANQVVLELRRMRKPVIAAINGIAAGGGFSIALACDFRVMASSAVMLQAYTSAGLSLDMGGTFTLPKIVGLARAMEILAFDQPIPSEKALEWGLVTRVADDERVLDEAMDMARELADRSLRAFGWVKHLLTDSFSTPFEAHIQQEREAMRNCAAHRDGQEGITAFIEKRKPVFNPR